LRLIEELDIGYKDRIKQIYRELSQAIHPLYRQIEKTIEEFYNQSLEIAAIVDCREIRNIYESLIKVYDVLLFLYLTYFPEIKKSLSENKDFANFLKNYRFFLVPKIMGS
jgi:hypothetical protein